MVIFFLLFWGGRCFCCWYFGFFSVLVLIWLVILFVCLFAWFFFSFWISTKTHIRRLDVIFRVENSSFVQNKMESTIFLANPTRHSKCIQFPWTSKGMLSKSHTHPDLTILKYHIFDVANTNVVRSVEHRSAGIDIPQMQMEWATGAHQRSCWSPILLVLCRRWNQETDSHTCQKLQSDPNRQDGWLWLLNAPLSPLLWLRCD